MFPLWFLTFWIAFIFLRLWVFFIWANIQINKLWNTKFGSLFVATFLSHFKYFKFQTFKLISSSISKSINLFLTSWVIPKLFDFLFVENLFSFLISQMFFLLYWISSCFCWFILEFYRDDLVLCLVLPFVAFVKTNTFNNFLLN